MRRPLEERAGLRQPVEERVGLRQRPKDPAGLRRPLEEPAGLRPRPEEPAGLRPRPEERRLSERVLTVRVRPCHVLTTPSPDRQISASFLNRARAVGGIMRERLLAGRLVRACHRIVASSGRIVEALGRVVSRAFALSLWRWLGHLRR